LNKKIGQRDKVKELQKNVNDYQKELKDAHARKDEAKIKELSAREKEMMDSMKQMTLLPMKTMIVILPMWFILFYFVLPALFPRYLLTDMPFSVPSSIAVWQPWKNWLGARGLFIYSTVFVGLFIELVFARIEKKIFKKPQQQAKKEQAASQ
jgi:uncharacterized membrane protein (DUF106 family)